MAEIVLFHSVLGPRAGMTDAADRLRAAGHTVHTPDLYYRLASMHLEVLKDDAYGRSVREGTMQALAELLAELGETRNGVDPASSG
jgi:dienelactone hydrolase